MDKSVSAAALGGIAGPSLTDRLVGAGCALLAVAIWGGWIVSTRHAVHGHLPPMTVGWLRFVVPAVVLAPAWIRDRPVAQAELRALPALFFSALACSSSLMWRMRCVSSRRRMWGRFCRAPCR
ncbi:hypothetical protein ACFSKM_04330 [Ancylobacter dichloromethanicus]